MSNIREPEIHSHICTVRKPVYSITNFGLRVLTPPGSAKEEGRIRSFTVSTEFVKTPLAHNEIPAQAKQRGIRPEQVVKDGRIGKTIIKKVMSPVGVANLFVFGFSSYAKYLVGGDLLFDGGMALS